MKNKRSLWISLISVVAISVIALTATLASGWSPKLGLDLDGGLSVVYQTHTPVNQTQLDTIVSILSNRVGATSGANVASQGKNQISVQIPGEKNTQQILATLGNTAQLFFRPALCYAPAFSVAKGKTPSTGALPTCSAATQLTKANLQVTPDSSNVNGYTQNSNISEDPAFETYKSTPALSDNKNDTVLLPGTAAEGSGRYVLGPAQMTGTAVKSASAQLNNGQWAVNLVLTGPGSTTWDNLAKQQFHAIIGIDLDGQVISAPITQPTQQSFTPFNGQVQISGSFTEDEAKTLATEFTYGALPVKLDRLTVRPFPPPWARRPCTPGLISGLAGLLLVLLYVIFYYRLLGVVVVAGLAVTGALLWTIISILGRASTPPSTWPASSGSSCRSGSPSTPTSSISND